jgi:hypothetical protein
LQHRLRTRVKRYRCDVGPHAGHFHASLVLAIIIGPRVGHFRIVRYLAVLKLPLLLVLVTRYHCDVGPRVGQFRIVRYRMLTVLKLPLLLVLVLAIPFGPLLGCIRNLTSSGSASLFPIFPWTGSFHGSMQTVSVLCQY